MSILKIQARIQCDGCNTNFIVELDAARMRPKGWALADEITDEVRGGFYDVPKGGRRNGTSCSVQGDMHLCAGCTDIVDKHAPENPTAEQVTAALDKHAVGVMPV